jgi:hypothetical protein
MARYCGLGMRHHEKHKLAAGELLNAVEAPMRENAHITQLRRK